MKNSISFNCTAKPPRKWAKKHYDGERQDHPDGTSTVWCEFPKALVKIIAREAGRVGVSINEFILRAIKDKYEALAARPGGEKAS